MYLVLPNSAALRYGIGVGTTCAELVGPRKISNKVEWPEWTPPPGSGRPGPMPGGPGNPLGARLLDLDDNVSRIHGRLLRARRKRPRRRRPDNCRNEFAPFHCLTKRVVHLREQSRKFTLTKWGRQPFLCGLGDGGERSLARCGASSI